MERIRKWDDLAARRHKDCEPGAAMCEVGCGPATHSDVEGVPLCCRCWEEAPAADPDY